MAVHPALLNPGRRGLALTLPNQPTSASVCSYSKNCRVGQTATCGVGTVYKAAPCSPQFLEFYYIYFNFGAGNVCAPTGLAVGSSVPGNCD